MKMKQISSLSNKLTFACCAAIIAFYAVKAYYQVPSDQHFAFHSWLTELRQQDDPANLLEKTQLRVQVTTEDGQIDWNLTAETGNADFQKKIIRILDLLDTSDVFLYEDAQGPGTIQIALTTAQQDFNASIHKDRLRESPALQTLLALSKVYATEMLKPRKEVAHANP